MQLIEVEEFQRERDDMKKRYEKLEQDILEQKEKHQIEYERLENDVIKYRKKSRMMR